MTISPPRKVIFDTDPGVDDAMALYFALAHPGMEVVGITTTFGNVTVAQAAINAQSVVDSLSAQGFSRIEVKTGLTQIKVEAVTGNSKVEVIYDALTGAILKQETSRANPDDLGTGVEVSQEDHDFLGQDSADNSGNDDGSADNAGDDGQDNSGPGSDDDSDGAGSDSDSGDSGEDNSGNDD